LNPFNDPYVLMFPGQGAQQVGMGHKLYLTSEGARRVFLQAQEILGFDVPSLCFGGPESELNRTINTQPAVLATSIAAVEALRERFQRFGRQLEPAFVAGHSFGEFAAAVVAQAIDLADGLRLVFDRARLMQQAQDQQPGAMISVIGLSEETLAQVCATAAHAGEILTVAVENGPGHLVLSGDIPAVERAMPIVHQLGGKAIRLPIGVGAHSPLMEKAAGEFSRFVEKVTIHPPRIPILSNVTARPLTTSDEVRRELTEQFTQPVLWARSVRALISLGVTSFIEVGPGQILSRLVRRMSDSVRSISLNASPEEIDRLFSSEQAGPTPAKEAL
jgi:[acyl-carrier-protein] S-malonyltransferase